MFFLRDLVLFLTMKSWVHRVMQYTTPLPIPVMQCWVGDWFGIAPESYPSFQESSYWFRAAPKVTMTSHIGSQCDLFFIHFPLLIPYSPKPNHCGRIRRHLLDLIGINPPIMLRGQHEQHYFRDETFPSMLGLLAKFLALP